MDCGSLVSITWSGIGNGIGVGGIGEVLVHVVAQGGVECGLGGWGQEVGHVIHNRNPYPS